MTDRLVDVSLTEWEGGIDLILDTRVALPPTQVWPHVTRSQLVEAWFVGYSAGEGDDQIVLELDDQPATAHVLSIEAPETDEDQGTSCWTSRASAAWASRSRPSPQTRTTARTARICRSRQRASPCPTPSRSLTLTAPCWPR